MKPTIQLINALRRAADAIEKNTIYYSWNTPKHCNCGVLAQACGVQVEKISGSIYGDWTNAARHQQRCLATGLPILEVFSQLLGFGIEPEDFAFIEHLDNPDVIERLGWVKELRPDLWSGEGPSWKTLRLGKPECVIAYFRAQADILEEQLAEQFETRPLSPVLQEQVHATDGLAHGSGTACQLALEEA